VPAHASAALTSDYCLLDASAEEDAPAGGFITIELASPAVQPNPAPSRSSRSMLAGASTDPPAGSKFTLVLHNADVLTSDLQTAISGLKLAQCHAQCASRPDCALLMYGSVDTCTDCCWLKAAVDFSKTITRAGLTAYLPGQWVLGCHAHTSAACAMHWRKV
jgi:hypothetical protein